MEEKIQTKGEGIKEAQEVHEGEILTAEEVKKIIICKCGYRKELHDKWIVYCGKEGFQPKLFKDRNQ